MKNHHEFSDYLSRTDIKNIRASELDRLYFKDRVLNELEKLINNLNDLVGRENETN